MSNFPIKIIYYSVTWYLITQTYHIKTIQLPWHKNYFNDLNPAKYEKHCSLIDSTQKIHGYALIASYFPTYKKNKSKIVSSIQSKREAFKSQLIASEQEVFTTIKKKYHVNDIIWNQCLTTIKNIKNHYNNGLLKHHPSIKHDTTIPADTLNTLKTLLQQNNINPQSVHIKMVSDQKQTNENIKTLACVESFIIASENGKKNKHLFIEPHYIPSTINISSFSNTFSSTEKISLFAHEIEHLLQQHSLTTLILEEYLNYYYGIKPEQFRKTPEYHKLLQIHEAQAEICAAIKNPSIAHCLTEMRKKYPYPNLLYQEHFYHISTINMLWKVQEWLEFFYTKCKINFTFGTTKC